jgi:PKD repeat protein
VGTVPIQIDATDAEDPAGTLTVQWTIDGGAWQSATWNGVSGTYEASWDSTAVSDGPHTVNAQATDSEANVGSDSVNVTVDNVNEPPVASFTYNCTGLSCDFDGTGSYDTDGTIAAYDWDFGDGSPHGSGATANHTYATGNTYSVVLTVTDDDTATGQDAQAVNVNESPVASFIFSCTDLSCDFDATASYDPDGTIVAFDWDFGDGSQHGSGATASHTYADGGVWTVVLTVTDDDDATDTDTQPVTLNDPPTASFIYTCTLLACDFDASGSSDVDGTIVSYDWDFGDESSNGSGATASHTYATGNTYTVVLTVTDDGGATDDEAQNVAVSETLTVHVGDLDGLSAPSPGRWEATVTIAVQDSSESAVTGALVEGAWSNGASGSDSCTTNASGQCSVTVSGLKKNVSSVTWTVTDVTSGVGAYAPGDNHDPDGDSDGTTIVVPQ